MEMIAVIDGRLHEQPIHHERQILNKKEVNQYDELELVKIGDDGQETVERVKVLVTGQKLRNGSVERFQVSAHHLVLQILDGVRAGQVRDGRWDHIGIDMVRPNDRAPYYWQADTEFGWEIPDDPDAYWLDTGVYLRTLAQQVDPTQAENQ